MSRIRELINQAEFVGSDPQTMLLDRFPQLEEIEHCREAISIAFKLPERIAQQIEMLPQHRWLFELAGRLKGLYSDYRAQSVGFAEMLSPFALIFAAKVVQMKLAEPKGGRREYINWLDDDAVILEFEDAWIGRKYPKASRVLESAVEAATQNRVNIQGNKYFVWIVNIAFELAVAQNRETFILPISEKLAALMGTSRATVGSAVLKAEREGWIRMVRGAEKRKRIARVFEFDFEKLESHWKGIYDPFAD